MTSQYVLRQPEIYIAAMARSGSTALANMLSVPLETQILIEPTAAVFGFKNFNLAKSKIDQTNYVNYCKNEIMKHEKLKAWGIKEVRPNAHAGILDILMPKRTIILVRNIRNVYLSLIEKTNLSGPNDPHDQNWIENYCISAAEDIVKFDLILPKIKENIVIRYEDFYLNSEYKKQICASITLPMTGDPELNLDAYGRTYEIQRNRQRTTMKELSLNERGLDACIESRVNIIVEKCHLYQKHFGY